MRLCLFLIAVCANQFHENLLLRPLEDGKVLAHFQFDMESANNGQHFMLFPKSMGQILSRFRVQELSMTLTQGRWKFDRWGYPMPGVKITNNGTIVDVTPHAGPVGAELMAWLDNDGDVEENWTNLQHALAGIFCASFHQIGVKHTSIPQWAFRSRGPKSQFRYGALPRENVCTENLTPWLKLLPCRNQAGLGKLLKSYRLFNGFHSLSAHVTPLFGSDGSQNGWALRQTIDVVLDPLAGTESPNWSLESLFGVQRAQACSVATRSAILLEISPWMQAKFPVLSSNATITAPSETIVAGGSRVNVYWLQVEQGTVLEVKYNSPTVHAYAGQFLSTPALLFDRYFAGRGQLFGKLVVDLNNVGTTEAITVSYFDALPWFLKLFYHTLTITRDGQKLDLKKDLRRFRFLPSKRHASPTELEFELDLPAGSSTQLTIEFEKAFLSMNDFPPDVSRGFDVQAGVVTLMRPAPVQLYTESLLIVLPSPDFSMPFNVIAFTSTLLAFFFGSLFNTLYSSPAEVLKRGRTTLGQRLGKKILAIAKKFSKCRQKAPKQQQQQPAAVTETTADGTEPSEPSTETDKPHEE